ncbi:hypothetical protein WA588_002371 [Blastocystis sp. NMH]
MEDKTDEQIESLRSKIAILKADRDDLTMKLALVKQSIQSLHSDLGQIMEFIVEKRKDLRFIGPEYTGVLKGDEETLIHETEFEYPNIHTLVWRDFETAHEKNPSINRIRQRGADLFVEVNAANVKGMYPSIPEETLSAYLNIIWKQMTFYEKKNWMEKRVVYPREKEEGTSEKENDGKEEEFQPEKEED